MAGLKGMTAKCACTGIRMAKILWGLRCPNPCYCERTRIARAHFWKLPNHFGPFLDSGVYKLKSNSASRFR